MFWLVDSDIRPVWLKQVNRATADQWLESGEAFQALPADSFTLTFAIRHNSPARWYLFPVEVA